MVVIHHMPGYDAPTKEIARNFAFHGYNAVMPNLYWREAPGASPDDAAATARAAGGVPDDRLVGDVAGAVAYLKGLTNSNGKVGTIGYCSGGRQSFLAAVSLPLDAAVDCYGAFVVGTPPEGMPLKVGPIVDKTPEPVLPAARPVRRGRSAPVARAGRRAGEGAAGGRQDVRVPQLRGRRARVLLGQPARLPARGGERRLAEDLRLLRHVPRLTRPGSKSVPHARMGL